MNKGNKATAGASSRLFVDQSRPLLLQFPEGFANILNLNRDVMNTRTPLREELRNRRVGCRRFEQFNPRLANRQHRYPHFLLRHFFHVFDLKAQCFR